MRISNQSLVKTLLESEIKTNDLVVYFDIIIKLFKNHKKSIFSKDVLKIIEQTDKLLFTLIMILKHHNKTDITSLKNIIKEIKQQATDYTQTFTVNTIENSEKYDIVKGLSDKFPNCSVKKENGLELGAYISGEGRYYKRNIDQDLQKLL